MDIVKEIEKLHKNIKVELKKDYLIVYNPKYKFDMEFDLEDGDDEALLKVVKETLEYESGKSLLEKDSFEILIQVIYQNHYFPEDTFEIIPSQRFRNECFYEIGEISPIFEMFLKNTVSSDYFDSDYCSSLRIHNLEAVLKLNSKEEIKKAYENTLNSIIFDLHRKYGLKIEIFDFNDAEEIDHDYHNSSPEVPEIEDTKIDLNIYDKDLISYYNRAMKMTESEFKYLAYFQVLECIFDEVYREETIQDVRGILRSSDFSILDNKSIGKLIEVVETYNKEKNDRTKTQLVLDKYFKGDLRPEAYNMVNKQITDLLIEMKLIKDTSGIKDLNKLAAIIYDFRNKCAHSNRSYPIKKSTVISNNNLSEYILLIQKVAERVILNYNISEVKYGVLIDH